MSPNDLKIYVGYKNAKSVLEKRENLFKSLSPFSSQDNAAKIFAEFQSAAINDKVLSEKWRKIKSKNETIDGGFYIASQISKIYVELESYSGDNSHRLIWTDSENEINASTSTESGDTYSRKCKYRKTNATHYFTLNYEWAAQLVHYKDIVEKSNEENLPLIGLKRFSEKDFSTKGLGRESGPNKDKIKSIKWLKNNLKGNYLFYAKWVKGNKSIKKQDGFIAARGSSENNSLIIFHSEKSPEHALKGLNQKISIKKSEDRQRKNLKNGRGALFGQKTINLKEVQALTGWCGPGCKGWLDKYMGGKTKAPYHIVADAAHKAKKSGDIYGEKLLELMGLGSIQINYTNPNPFTLWINSGDDDIVL